MSFNFIFWSSQYNKKRRELLNITFKYTYIFTRKNGTKGFILTKYQILLRGVLGAPSDSGCLGASSPVSSGVGRDAGLLTSKTRDSRKFSVLWILFGHGISNTWNAATSAARAMVQSSSWANSSLSMYRANSHEFMLKGFFTSNTGVTAFT